jgi:hypothetical protein
MPIETRRISTAEDEERAEAGRSNEGVLTVEGAFQNSLVFSKMRPGFFNGT